MTEEEGKQAKKEKAARRNEIIRERLKMEDNVNQYSVKHKLELKKV